MSFQDRYRPDAYENARPSPWPLVGTILAIAAVLSLFAKAFSGG
ncbi:hypothetical protein [Polymorphum gilvum]|nr:hypothetical protein [Polymorphum gilvum]